MNDTPLIFIDIETTGTRATRDRITEIAALKMMGGHVVERWVSLIQPTTGVSAHISRLTGIDDAMLKDAPTFACIAEELNGWLGRDTLVAHNARFDAGFLRTSSNAPGLLTDPK